MYSKCPVAHNALLCSMFDQKMPNRAIFNGVLDGTIAGNCYLDDASNPNQAVVFSDFLGCAFVSEHCSIDSLKSSVQQNGYDNTAIVLQKTAPQIEQDSEQFDLVSRKEFFWNTNQEFDASNVVSVQPSKEQFEQALWFDLFSPSCGDYEQMIANHVARYSISEGQIMSEAYAVVGGRLTELGVITHEPFRRQGSAKVSCRGVLALCRSIGSQPVWTCNADNTPSIHTALSLGFTHHQDYFFASLKQ